MGNTFLSGLTFDFNILISIFKFESNFSLQSGVLHHQSAKMKRGTRIAKSVSPFQEYHIPRSKGKQYGQNLPSRTTNFPLEMPCI